MAIIDSVKLPDNSTYEVADNHSGYQKETLTTPLTINGTQKTTVEGALGGLNDYGDALADNLAANENVCGAKNLLDINNLSSMSAYKCHVANNGFVNDETDTLDYFRLRLVAYDSNNQIIQVGGNNYVFSENVTTTGQKEITGFTLPAGTANVLLTHTGANINIYVNPTVNLDIIEIPLTLSFNANGINPSSIGGLDIRDIMLRDARILDPTFAPYAKTNLQLTNDVASIFDILPNNAGAHNRYRGKALTIDADFWAHISDGTFENQFVGDTITINGRTYILAHANYWLHTGDTECTANHWVVISPVMGNAKMNSDNSTVGGYLGSGLRRGTNHDSTPNTALADALATIKSDFGASHILSHRELLDNAVTGGYPSAGAWATSEAELMSQIMVYGNRFFDPSTNLGATIPYLYSIDKSQLALYAQRPDLLTDRSNWWLRDVVSAAHFAYVANDGAAGNNRASDSLGVRLAFGIIA